MSLIEIMSRVSVGTQTWQGRKEVASRGLLKDNGTNLSRGDIEDVRAFHKASRAVKFSRSCSFAETYSRFNKDLVVAACVGARAPAERKNPASYHASMSIKDDRNDGISLFFVTLE